MAVLVIMTEVILVTIKEGKARLRCQNSVPSFVSCFSGDQIKEVILVKYRCGMAIVKTSFMLFCSLFFESLEVTLYF